MNRFRDKLRKGLLITACLCGCAAAANASITIAAAANLVYALDGLKVAFHAEHPEIEVKTITGASGNLFAQVKAGAPYDVFLSADTDYPQQLVKAKLADETTLVTFARGRLAFWTLLPDVKLNDLADALADARFRKIALANPQTAPYGRAAKQVLLRLNQWQDGPARWVYGENISQTAQFVESGNADGGFVALSLLLSPRLKSKGRYTVIPEDWHDPLDHAGVLTLRGGANPDARLFLQFLRGASAKKVLEDFGYSIPP